MSEPEPEYDAQREQDHEPDSCAHDDSYLLTCDCEGDSEPYQRCASCNCIYTAGGILVAIGTTCAFLRLYVSMRRR